MLGHCLRPRWGELTALPQPLAVFKELTSKGMERKREGRGRDRQATLLRL